jgi:deazaflavin-dependent oxidoreductase (nitroreductase family)
MPSEPQFLYLTTTGRHSGLPRKIEIWFTEREGRFYIIAEHGLKAQWVQNLEQNPEVTWKAGETEYRGRARILSLTADPDLYGTIQNLSRQKYGWGDGLLVELTPSSSDS